MTIAWQPIETAPREGRFLVWNRVTGLYVTRREGDEFPLRGWGGLGGVWYPRPTHWAPLNEPRDDAAVEIDAAA